MVVAVLCLAATAVTFAPFGRSGSRTRNSYGLVDVADRAGLLASPYDRLAPVWYLLPALCGAVVLAASTQRGRLAGVGATMLGALVAVAGVLVHRSPLVAEPAATIAIPLGAITAMCGIAVFATATTKVE